MSASLPDVRTRRHRSGTEARVRLQGQPDLLVLLTDAAARTVARGLLGAGAGALEKLSNHHQNHKCEMKLLVALQHHGIFKIKIKISDAWTTPTRGQFHFRPHPVPHLINYCASLALATTQTSRILRLPNQCIAVMQGMR